jgi:hypothetical protein
MMKGKENISLARIHPSGREEPAEIPWLCNKRRIARVAYIAAEGDTLPAEMERQGFHVELLDPHALETADLFEFDGIILGLYSVETREDFRLAVPRINAFTASGRVSLRIMPELVN